MPLIIVHFEPTSKRTTSPQVTSHIALRRTAFSGSAEHPSFAQRSPQASCDRSGSLPPSTGFDRIPPLLGRLEDFDHGSSHGCKKHHEWILPLQRQRRRIGQTTPGPVPLKCSPFARRDRQAVQETPIRSDRKRFCCTKGKGCSLKEKASAYLAASDFKRKSMKTLTFG
jgi:hypothetical protein